MKYIFLAVTVLFIAGQTILNKQFSKKKPTTSSTLLFQAMCSTSIALFFLIASGGRFIWHFPTFLFGLLFCCCFETVVFSKLLAISNGPMSLTSLISSFSLILPAFYGILILHEKVSGWLIVGLLLLLISLVLINYSGKSQQKPKLKWIIFVLLVFLSDGFCAIIQKTHQMVFPGQYANELMFTVGVCASIVNWSIYAVSHFTGTKNVPHNKASFATGKFAIFYGFPYGLLIAAVNLLVIITSRSLPASLMFPMISAGGIVLSILASLIIYREKLSKTQWIGCLLGILAVIALNI